MGWELQGKDYVLRERTRKPFERFKIDATRGLLTGLAAFFTTHKWEGTTCRIESLGARGDLTLEHGVASELKNFLTQLGLQPFVLYEQDDLGMTIIDKFEHYATTCSFAFVLMTPDGSNRGCGLDRFAAASAAECNHGAGMVHGISRQRARDPFVSR